MINCKLRQWTKRKTWHFIVNIKHIENEKTKQNIPQLLRIKPKVSVSFELLTKSNPQFRNQFKQFTYTFNGEPINQNTATFDWIDDLWFFGSIQWKFSFNSHKKNSTQNWSLFYRTKSVRNSLISFRKCNMYTGVDWFHSNSTAVSFQLLFIFFLMSSILFFVGVLNDFRGKLKSTKMHTKLIFYSIK